MPILIWVFLLLVLFGGGWGGYHTWGPGGLIGTIIFVIVVFWLLSSLGTLGGGAVGPSDSVGPAPRRRYWSGRWWY
jgi:hypothetical protein